MESSGAGGRNRGLPSKAGVIGDDHIDDRKIPSALSCSVVIAQEAEPTRDLEGNLFVLALVGSRQP